MPLMADEKLNDLAVQRASLSGGITQDEELISVMKEYNELGEMAFSFDSGTTAAVKQMRHKLMMAQIGSVNLEIDEIGSNLLGNAEVLNTFLELFDVGKVKQKLTKNTRENTRAKEIQGKTPTNLMLFGTPVKLFDGSKVEEEYWSFIGSGYGRRCFFGYSREGTKNRSLTPEQVYDLLTSPVSEKFMEDISREFGKLALYDNCNKKVAISRDVSLILIEYQMQCENLAETMGDHQEMQKAELCHRYFKALKLAGGFAFIDKKAVISEDHLYYAIAMAEESGKAFNNMLNQDAPYVKLAKYIASVGREVTQVDLAEALPFYRGSVLQKVDLLSMATTWGHQNSVIIKQKMDNNIEFFTGETLKKTSLDHLFLSHSADVAVAYKNVQAPFHKLDELVKMDDHNWFNHHTSTGRRHEDNVVPGFNVVVIDVDGEIQLDKVHFLLEGFKYMTHTTKSHTASSNRFRILFPLNYNLKLNEEDFKEFMINVFEWLPFDCDTATGHRSRKWLTNKGADVYYSKGDELLDAMLFIPRTSKNAKRKSTINNMMDLNNVERWFISSMKEGKRNNQLIRYALLLIDSGYSLVEIEQKIFNLNSRSDTPLSDIEIRNTVMKSASSTFFKRQGA